MALHFKPLIGLIGWQAHRTCHRTLCSWLQPLFFCICFALLFFSDTSLSRAETGLDSWTSPPQGAPTQQTQSANTTQQPYKRQFCLDGANPPDPTCAPNYCADKFNDTTCFVRGSSSCRNMENDSYCASVKAQVDCKKYPQLSFCIGVLRSEICKTALCTEDTNKIIEATKNIDCNAVPAGQNATHCKDLKDQPNRTKALENVGLAEKSSFVFLGLDLQGLTSCLSCDLVEELAQTAFDLGGQAYEILKTSVTAFLAAVFGIYILLQAGKLLFPFGPLESASGVLNSVMTRTFVIIAAMTFLTSFGNYWNLIHTPPLASAINLTSALMDKTKSALIGTALIKESCQRVDSADAAAIGTAMSCTMRNAQNTVLQGLIAGITAMLSSAQTNNPLILFTSAAAGVVITFFGGLYLLWIYAPIYFSMPLKMADIILRWTLLAVLSPLVIAAAVFPATRSLVAAALKGLLQVAFELFMYGIVVAFGAYAMNAVIASLPSNNTGSSLFIDFTSQQGVYSPLITSAMFWQFLLIGWIINILLAKSRGVAIALSDPTPNPSGMHAAAFDELGQKAAERINNLGAKGFNWASGVWKSRMS